MFFLPRLSQLLFSKNLRSRHRIPIGVGQQDDKLVFFSYLNQTHELWTSNSVSYDSFQSSAKPHLLPDELEKNGLNRVTSFSFQHQRLLLLEKNKGSVLIQQQPQQSRLSFIADLPELPKNCVIVANQEDSHRLIGFAGERAVHLVTVHDLKTWNVSPQPIFSTAAPSRPAAATFTEHGILLLYYQTKQKEGQLYYSAHLALLDARHPERVIWKVDEPIWEQESEWSQEQIQPIGAIFTDNHFVSYWWVNRKIIQAVKHTGFLIQPRKIVTTKKVVLQKHAANPLISPNQHNDWEAFNTFNPSAVYADHKVHILYRAQGYDYVSSIGYANSPDGMSISHRSHKPIFEPHQTFEVNTSDQVNPSFVSGGGFGGCEDPRLTIIGDMVYMIYVAFDGWSPPRLAMTSLSLKNFLKQRWLWTKPVLISPPGIVDKSGCLFPEKINGKYVFLHRVFPNILIDYVDDLNFDGKTEWLTGHDKISIRPGYWDSRKIGAGAPPLKTKDGWLLIYYGVDDKDAGKYHIGAMVLDLKNPAKVLYRSNQPILQPEESYEWQGFKPGVAYPCGAVIVEGKLFVYYGAADSVVCVATAPLDTFLADLKSQSTIHWEAFPIQEVP